MFTQQSACTEHAIRRCAVLGFNAMHTVQTRAGTNVVRLIKYRD